MAIGRPFREALGKGIRSLETGRKFGSETLDPNLIPQKLITPTPDRLSYLRFALRSGYTVEEIPAMPPLAPWFPEQLRQINDFEQSLIGGSLESTTRDTLSTAK